MKNILPKAITAALIGLSFVTVNAQNLKKQPGWAANMPKIDMKNVRPDVVEQYAKSKRASLAEDINFNAAQDGRLSFDERMYLIANTPDLSFAELTSFCEMYNINQGNQSNQVFMDMQKNFVAKVFLDRDFTPEEQKLAMGKYLAVQCNDAILYQAGLDFDAYKIAAEVPPPFFDGYGQPQKQDIYRDEYDNDIFHIAATRKFTKEEQLQLAQASQNPAFDKALISNPAIAQEVLDYYKNKKFDRSLREAQRLYRTYESGAYNGKEWFGGQVKEIIALANSKLGGTLNSKETPKDSKSGTAEENINYSKTVAKDDFRNIEWNIQQGPSDDKNGNAVPPDGALLEIAGKYNLTQEQQMSIVKKSCRPEIDKALISNPNASRETLKEYAEGNLTAKYYYCGYSMEEARRHAESVKNTASSVLAGKTVKTEKVAAKMTGKTAQTAAGTAQAAQRIKGSDLGGYSSK